MCYASFRKAHSSNVWEYAPIAKTLAELSMDAITRESIKRKLDIAYMILRKDGMHQDAASLHLGRATC